MTTPTMMRRSAMTPPGFMARRLNSSTGDEINNQHHDGEHEQDVNESTERVRTHQAEQPKHQQNNEYCPQHKFLRLRFNLLRIRRPPRVCLGENYFCSVCEAARSAARTFQPWRASCARAAS